MLRRKTNSRREKLGPLSSWLRESQYVVRSSAYLLATIWVVLGGLLYSKLGLRDTMQTHNLIHRHDLGTAMYFAIITLTTIGFGDFVPATALGNALLVPYVIIGLPLIALVLIDVADSRAEHTKLCVARCPCPSLRALIDENRFAALSLTLVSTTLLAAACISSFETSYTGEDNHGDMLYSTALFLCFATTTTIGYGEIAPRSPVSRATVCIYAFLTLAIFSMLVSEASSWWSRVTQEPPKTVEDAPDDSTALIEELV